MSKWKMEKKKAEECREFDLINSASRTVWKNRTKLLARLNRTDRELSYLVSLNEVTSMRRRSGSLSNTEVTLYQLAVPFYDNCVLHKL
jgi:hypothetical protein